MDEQPLHQLGSKALRRSTAVSSLLVLVKLAAYIPTGSLVVLTSLLDSLGDSVSSLINLYVHKRSQEDPDREHPFGHGGFEVVASLIQGMVMLFLGISLGVESLRKLVHPEASRLDYEALPLAVVLMIFSALAGFLLQRHLGMQIKRLEEAQGRSLVLSVDRAHYAGDAVVNLLAAAGLIAVYLTQWPLIDALAGFGGALFLLGSALPVLRQCFRDILHNQAPPELQQQIVDIVFGVDARVKGLHYFRSREHGPHLFVDFHMQVDRNLSLIKAHDITHKVEKAIKAAIPRADVIIHIDPDTELEETPWAPAYTLPEEKEEP